MTDAKMDRKAQDQCPRCCDMFYHPKTMIADARQQAQEWEDEAKRLQSQLQAKSRALDRLIESLERISDRCLDERKANGSVHMIAQAALRDIEKEIGNG